MIYNTMALANSVLAMVDFLGTDTKEYILYAYKGLGESGYTLIRQGSDMSISFAQSASGDSLVVYPCDRWVVAKLTQEELDDISVYFGCDDLFNAAKYIIDSLE